MACKFLSIADHDCNNYKTYIVKIIIMTDYDYKKLTSNN